MVMPVDTNSSSTRLLGDSPQMRAVMEQIRRVAPTSASVLLTGESGSGKELAARAVHEQSQRSAHPFIAINCGAIAVSLIEAELFGHERGSFTGAIRAHAGVFERVHGGTLFLDEVTEMPCDLQVRLLRVLETSRFLRVGGVHELTVDVRFIAATNRCPLQAVSNGTLRDDLLYRLAVFPIELPTLRDRGADVEQLARHFLAMLNAHHGTSKRLSNASLKTLRQHHWPGNVRELRNAVERAFILGDHCVELTPMLVPARTSSQLKSTTNTNGRTNVEFEVGVNLQQAERSLIEATLQRYAGNKTQAAVALGCSVKTLYNKLNSYTRIGAFSVN